MAELMPSDGEELERVDEHACAGDVPEGKDDDGVYNDLRQTEIRNQGEVRLWRACAGTHDVECWNLNLRCHNC